MEKKKSDYFKGINAELEQLQEPFRFSEISGQTLSQGELVFKTKLIDKWGTQLYQIVKAEGALEHVSNASRERNKIFSEFKLIENNRAFIRASVRDLISGGLLIKPEFQQLYRTSLSKVFPHQPLVAVTRIDLLPRPDISETIYLREQEDGSNIPVAYGVYRPL